MRLREMEIVAVAVLLFVLAQCSLYPPVEGVEGGPQGLDGIAHRFGVQPLDPASSVPLTKQALEEIEKTDPLRQLKGTTYELTQGNRLPANWLIQTPDVWNKPAAAVSYIWPGCADCTTDLHLPLCHQSAECGGTPCITLHASVSRPGMRARKFCVGHSDDVVDRFHDLIISARQAVDVTLLQPPPDGRFLAAIRNAITWLAYSGRKVTIRIMIGNFPPAGTDLPAFINSLMRDASAARHSRLHVYVGKIRSCDGGSPCDTLSWNHSKIVAVDGTRVVSGGHNMWTEDYLLAAPVHDLSMEIDGRAARTAHRFADALWGFVCSRPADDQLNHSYQIIGDKPRFAHGCLSRIELPHESEAAGDIPILTVGRLGAGIRPDFADQDLIARDLMLGAATRTIRMVQQDIAFSLVLGSDKSWPDSALERMADLMAVRHGDVYLVLSNQGAQGRIGTYSNDVPLQAVADRLLALVEARNRLAKSDASALLCRHLHLAPLRFGPDATWPDNQPIGVHAKFWMVDDRVFYIGSDNLYPVDLQEFGNIVEDRAASAQFLRDYWNHVWQWSRSAAISGDDAPRCVFATPKS